MGFFRKSRDEQLAMPSNVFEQDPMRSHSEGERTIDAFFTAGEGDQQQSLMIPESMSHDKAFWAGMKTELVARGCDVAAIVVGGIIQDLQRETPIERVDIARRLGEVQKAITGESREKKVA